MRSRGRGVHVGTAALVMFACGGDVTTDQTVAGHAGAGGAGAVPSSGGASGQGSFGGGSGGLGAVSGTGGVSGSGGISGAGGGGGAGASGGSGGAGGAGGEGGASGAGGSGGSSVGGSGGTGGGCGDVFQPCCADSSCNVGYTCDGGQCVLCAFQCEGKCVDLTSDAQNCGACNNHCPALCSSGVCVSATGVDLGMVHTCASLSDGSVKCWGNGSNLQLGAAVNTQASTPTSVIGVSDAASVALGFHHSCAVLKDGSVRCWGFNVEGPLGSEPLGGEVGTPLTPVGLSGVVGMAGGSGHTCAMLADGTVSCFGRNVHGQLGDGSFASHTIPASVPGLTDVVGIVAGDEHTCAVKSNGSVLCWGANTTGQLGLGTTNDASTPSVVSLPSVTQVAADAHTCARLANGSVTCWGGNLVGQLGATPSLPSPTPKVVSGLAGVISVAVGEGHSCALLWNKTVRCWGANNEGQLGSGTVGGLNHLPQTVVGLSGVAKLAAGGSHACALLESGELRCWGRNDFGQLGNGTTVSSAKPTAVVW